MSRIQKLFVENLKSVTKKDKTKPKMNKKFSLSKNNLNKCFNIHILQEDNFILFYLFNRTKTIL